MPPTRKGVPGVQLVPSPGEMRSCSNFLSYIRDMPYLRRCFKAIALCLLLCPVITRAQYDKVVAIAQAMSNTFNLYGDKLTGTCFMVKRHGEQYFVTAAHLFQDSHRTGDRVTIQLVVQNQLQSYEAKVYFHSDRKVDVAVLKLAEDIQQNADLPDELMKYKDTIRRVFRGNGIPTDTLYTTIGMESYFFGFPLGNLGTEVFGIKFPLIKKAIISGFVKHDGVELMLLDGHNNLGFSGGPVVAYEETSKEMRMVGVISGYLPEPIDIKQKNGTLSVMENSGIIVCYGSRYIGDIFEKSGLR